MRASEPLETYRLTTVEFEDLGDRVWRIGAATARELFFHDVPDELATWAQELLRPQSYGVFDEKSPLRSLARHPVRLHRVQPGSSARPGMEPVHRSGPSRSHRDRAEWRALAVPGPTSRAGVGPGDRGRGLSQTVVLAGALSWLEPPTDASRLE